jgi:hypothetical protein
LSIGKSPLDFGETLAKGLVMSIFSMPFTYLIAYFFLRSLSKKHADPIKHEENK